MAAPTGQPMNLIRDAAADFEAAGIDAPRLCAEMLLAHALDITRTQLYVLPREPICPEAADRFSAMVALRLTREPIQHIIGQTEFWSLTIKCDRRALVPRPETEHCVEAVLARIQDMESPLVIDLCTGSGCIAVAVAHSCPAAKVIATDISPEALSLTAENVRFHDLVGRIELLHGDLTEPIWAPPLAGQVDIVVSNPPYVTDAEMADLQAEVRDHDPHLALAGGTDGLDIYRRLFVDVPRILRPKGWMVLELGDGQSAAIRALAAETGWAVEEMILDGNRIERTCVVRRTGDG
jgi:release factor glutamine methyltransferase